jgi:transcriptional regulator with XRE-family HTH domain
MIYFQKNICFLRSRKSMTINKISKEAGFSSSQWNNYELGFSFPKFLDLIKISKYFNVSETDLIHTDLELNSSSKLNHSTSKIEENSAIEIVKIQNKLIKMQEEKIDELQNKITHLKNILSKTK